MLEIKLGEWRAIQTDALGRTSVGWQPGMSAAQYWLAGRAFWKFKADRAFAEREVRVVNAAGEVLVVATIDGLIRHEIGSRLLANRSMITR
ncbi:hypothetical protein AB0B25_30710 [Nocardia sp. NPDC049190]|uniref:hypothetical protein n=1 Tax=Nocardia sp. NPDC049190 TaxID=3155650 RepID=UPI0033F6DFF6